MGFHSAEQLCIYGDQRAIAKQQIAQQLPVRMDRRDAPHYKHDQVQGNTPRAVSSRALLAPEQAPELLSP
jgi:hypothetical protein